MNNSVKKFALFGNIYQTEKSYNIKQVIKDILDIDGKIIIENEFATFLENTTDLNLEDFNKFTSIDGNVDFALSFGGDGTFLKTAQQVGNSGIPIIGINTGRLGFISDLSPLDSKVFFQNLVQGNFTIEKRTLLMCKFIGEETLPNPYALNEVALLKHDISSMISISTYVDDVYLATYQADGLIISTPTGSTGYSLSVGGPIISPDSKSIILSPIAAHSLSVRPFVLNDDVKISLKVKSRSRNYMVAIDGRSESLHDSTSIEITKANYCIRIVRPKNHSFFDTLRNKLLWGVDKR